MDIRIITDNKKEFLPLLLEGDEQENQIDKYLERGDLFALYDPCLTSICVVTDEGAGTLEIQNLATASQFRRQGYAKKLVNYVAGYYMRRFNKIILGTGETPGILSFYKKCGFSITHRIPDYFTTHYDHPIYDEGILLKDKIYLSMDLNRKKFYIETERLIITEFDVSMIGSVHKNSLDDDVKRFVPDEVFETEKEACKTVLSLIGHYSDDTGPFVYPVLLENAKNIGYVQAAPINGGWEIGYHIAKPYTGNGYATEAVQAFLPVIMAKLGIESISGICAAENIASRKVLEKCGFELQIKSNNNYYYRRRT